MLAYVPGFNNGWLVKVSWGPNPSQNSDTLAYDAEGRLKKQTRMVNDQTFIYEVTAYDTLDRPTSVKLPSGEVVATTYDEEGVNALTAGATSLISKVGYNERGQSTLLERPGAGPETTLSYYGAADNFRLSGITNSGDGNLPDFSYGNYDAIGNLTQFAAGTDSYTYTYDDLNRLKKVTGAIGRDYTYDLLGNFDSVTRGGQVQDYTYAAGNSSRLMSVTNLPLTVDAAAGYDTWGNLRKYTLQGVAYELNFNAENRLASVKVGTAQPTVFAYDADGQRVMTTYPDGTIIYTPFPDYEVEDPPGSGANTVRTTYRLAGQIVAVQTKVGTATGTFYYTYTDHLGNITALSTAAGAFVTGSKARYDPFGTFTTTTPTSNPAISNHGFTGHRHNNTGANDLDLIYMNARYYMPLVGRFISPDTIVPDPGNPQSFNRYAYVLNSPMNYTDPSGHRPASGCEYESCGLGASSNNYLWQQPDGQLTPWDPALVEPRYEATVLGASANFRSGARGALGYSGSIGVELLFSHETRELTSFLYISGDMQGNLIGASGNGAIYIGGVNNLKGSNYNYSGPVRTVNGTASTGLAGFTGGYSYSLGDRPDDPQKAWTESIGWAPGYGISVGVADAEYIPIYTNNLNTNQGSWLIDNYAIDNLYNAFDKSLGTWFWLTEQFK